MKTNHLTIKMMGIFLISFLSVVSCKKEKTIRYCHAAYLGTGFGALGFEALVYGPALRIGVRF